jgi:hypothetical protein
VLAVALVVGRTGDNLILRIGAGDMIALPAKWTRHFPGWGKFPPPQNAIELAKEAAAMWTKLAEDLEKRQ